MNVVKSVADPGFSPGGAPTPKIAIIFHIFAENCMKMKEFGPPGGARVPGAPPWIRQCKYYPLFCKTYLYYSIAKVQLLRLMLCSHQPISTFITTSNLKLPGLNRCRNGWCWCELESVLGSAGVNNTTRCKHF